MFDAETESVVSMAWDVTHSECLHLRIFVFTDYLVGPEIVDFNNLALGGNNSDLFKVELEVFVGDFTPVDDHGDYISSGH